MTERKVDKQVRRAGRRVLQVYQEQEDFAQEAAKVKKATCVEGCSHCCYKFTTTSLAEGIAIAEYLLTETSMNWGFDQLMKTVYEAAKLVSAPDLNEAKYFEQQHPCPFLSPKKSCRIYKVRPAVCRYHYVVSDPSHCDVNAEDSSVLFLNLRALEMKVWSEADRVSKQAGMPLSVFAPLPIVVSWGMRALTEGRDTWLDGIDKLGPSFSLDYWLMRMTKMALEAGAFDLKCSACDHVQGVLGTLKMDERPKCPNCEDGFLELVQSAGATEAIRAETAS